MLLQVSAAALCLPPSTLAPVPQHEALSADCPASSGAHCTPDNRHCRPPTPVAEEAACLGESSSGAAEGCANGSGQVGQQVSSRAAEGSAHGSGQSGQPRPLYNTAALRLWLLRSCQSPRGGFRDKPGKPVDYYHTCYCLSGLALCQEVSGALNKAPML